MKKLLLILSIMTIFLSSCKVSNDVVSKNGISKRKYLKGYHIVGMDKTFKRKNFQETVSQQNIQKLPVKDLINIENLTAQNGMTDLIEITKKSKTEFSNDSKEIMHNKISFSEKEYKELKSNLKKTLKSKSTSEKNTNTVALLSLIFGSLGMLLSFVGAGILFSIAGLVLGIIGIQKEPGNILAKLGIIFSTVGILLFLAWVALFVILLI